MLLGKRPRPPMKRTTSMTEFTLDLNAGKVEASGAAAAYQPFDPQNGDVDQRFLTAATTVAPRNLRRNSADFIGTAHFLRECSLCKRRLFTGRDVYMYSSDTFCSPECRQQKITQDEKKGKSSLPSKKEAGHIPAGSNALVAATAEAVAAGYN